MRKSIRTVLYTLAVFLLCLLAACGTNDSDEITAIGQLKGFDIEMILLMAKEMDVHVEFSGMEFSAVLAAVQSGKAQIGAGSIIVTEERKQAVDFVEYYPAAFVLLVRGGQAHGDGAVSGHPSKRVLKRLSSVKAAGCFSCRESDAHS